MKYEIIQNRLNQYAVRYKESEESPWFYLYTYNDPGSVSYYGLFNHTLKSAERLIEDHIKYNMHSVAKVIEIK